ncbi:SIMPL domain-containing protein [Geodermatophilus sp. YIM 151500]|uniref:SIMPL domain-containing protein n=1 Tax=Geodermatophilus sp. YIM 151500 TaxID=2984531 RepID=UPI0021E48F08|nr:SIMPL domain-containing protein [Geodermatophilus sp. YIM 151500]MCV2489334.1 SIMPL domain-containing protein [Geodermatophilus sp. YIM 151500]
MPARRSLPPLLAAVTVVGAVLVYTLADAPGPVRAAPAEPAAAASVQVEGVGTATGTPDLLRVTLGVETTAGTVDEALATADDAARRLLEALRTEDVPDRDVRTVNVSVHPTYGGDGQSVTGYTARHDLDVTLRDLSGAGGTITAVVEAGGDAARVHGLTYALEDSAALREQARAEAFAAARRTAEQYAALAGRELGDVLEVRERRSPSGPEPLPAGDAAGGEALPLAPGSATVTVTAEVRWSLR